VSVAAAVLALILAAAAPSPPLAPSGFTAAVEAMVAKDGAPGAAAFVYRDGRLLYQARAGAIDPDSPLPVASASKWVAAALIMTLVDEGKLALDEPVGKSLPEIRGEAARITLRQLLSFTSGQGGLRGLADLRQPSGIALSESARRIAARPLEQKPGTLFEYGSGAYQIAGAMAERASGKSWHDLFEERLARPLGMTASRWSSPLHPEALPATLLNPNLQGGLVTTAADYGRFLGMIAGRGTMDGRRFLSAAAVEELERLQTSGLPLRLPRREQAGKVAGYALGNWCERAAPSGRCTLVSSPGALGTYPFVDFCSGVYGIVVMRHTYPKVASSIASARSSAIAAAGGRSGDCEPPQVAAAR
jgi:CubicO group peptidase (beta-lactamase class C family)